MFDACAAAEDRPSPAETRAERRMLRLSRLADIGLSIAEKLERQAELAAVHSEVDAVPDNLPHSKRLDEIGRAFAQVSRAVSLATALEDRIDKGLPALPDDDRPVREREAREKRAEVAEAVAHAIEADPCASRRRIVRLRLDLDRLLDAEVRDLDRFLRRPFHEIETRLRRDLGLDPEDDDFADRSRSAGGTPASRSSGRARGGSPRSRRGSDAGPSGSPASQDADYPSIPCRERSSPVRAVQGQAGACPRAGLRPDPGSLPLRGARFARDLEQPEPASCALGMGPRTARGQGPPASP